VGGQAASRPRCSVAAPGSLPTGEPAFTRSAFVAKKPNYDQPNWFGVGLAFSTSAALWALVSVFVWFCWT
uniref:Uncharacterized protein n=1 Tax=Calidris pygmaea TaxID=425635 RepID=A0A8C3PLJ5_9CHAR